jgi:hypothetical protein
MSPYHDNKLAMMGFDIDDDVKSYFSPTPAKRKRSDRDKMTAMQDFESPVNGATGSQNTPNGFYTGNGQVTGQFHDQQGYEPPFDLWSANAFPEAYESPYGDWYLNSYSVDDQVGGTAAPHHQSPTAQIDDMPTGAGQVDLQAAVADGDAPVKSEDQEQDQVSLTPLGGSEYEESDYDERRPSKVPKLNKDGIPRKPRQPRAKLLRWDDNDWKNVALGLVWACGENGIQIPFDQASQIVSESCTAGALQQALLKLRGKQIAEGFQIPSLRMAWTRKNKNSTPSKSSANAQPSQGTQKLMPPKRKPTRFAGHQSLLITLKRAYKDADRYHLAAPYVPTTAATGNSQASSTNGNATVQTSTTSSVANSQAIAPGVQAAYQALNGNSLANLPPSFPGNFAIATPPNTPGHHSSNWVPFLAQPRRSSSGNYDPDFVLAGNAPGLPGPSSQHYNTSGSVFLPEAPLTESRVKTHRRRMTVVEHDFNFDFPAATQPEPEPESKPRTSKKVTFSSVSNQDEAATYKPDWSDVYDDFPVTDEDLERNFGWQRQDDGPDDTWGGPAFPPNNNPFDGPDGSGGSSGLSV